MRSKLSGFIVEIYQSAPFDARKFRILKSQNRVRMEIKEGILIVEKEMLEDRASNIDHCVRSFVKKSKRTVKGVWG